MEVWFTVVNYSNIIYNQEALFFANFNNETIFSHWGIYFNERYRHTFLFCFLIGDAKRQTSRQRSGIHPLVHCSNVHSDQGWPRSREPHHLSHHLLALRVCISRELESGAGTGNQTQKLQCGIQASKPQGYTLASRLVFSPVIWKWKLIWTWNQRLWSPQVCVSMHES